MCQSALCCRDGRHIVRLCSTAFTTCMHFGGPHWNSLPDVVLSCHCLQAFGCSCTMQCLQLHAVGVMDHSDQNVGALLSAPLREVLWAETCYKTGTVCKHPQQNTSVPFDTHSRPTSGCTFITCTHAASQPPAMQQHATCCLVDSQGATHATSSIIDTYVALHKEVVKSSLIVICLPCKGTHNAADRCLNNFDFWCVFPCLDWHEVC